MGVWFFTPFLDWADKECLTLPKDAPQIPGVNWSSTARFL